MMGEPLWRLVSWLGLLVFFGFVGLVVWDQAKKRSRVQLEILKRKENAESRWKSIESDLNKLDRTNSNTQAYTGILERAKEELYKNLDETYGISARALSSRDLTKTLTENHGVSVDLCKSISGFLAFSEMIRFSSGAPQGPEGETERLTREWLDALQKICLSLPRNTLEKQV
jgi:hypothetical protein